MINPNDHIRYKNVISRRYRYHYHDINNVMKEFINDLVQLNVTFKGPMFYSINNVPMDEIVIGEFYMPIEEEFVEGLQDMEFHSYFSIEDMISICIYDDLERKTEMAYLALFQHIEKNNCRQTTPIFHILSGDETLQYMFIKVGMSM
ncbi:DUF5085 family protein [Niallia sp. XMNu-256]|uniref:DUF5085 family protein n=1 Tax=Niallia sp. XMNu-256 TaxID=3082444 RepID=UPI0030CE194E